MVRRATEGTGEAAYQRLARRTEEAQAEANGRMEAGFDRILDSIEGLKVEVRRVDQKHSGLDNRLGDLERQVIDTREELQKRAVNPAPAQIASAKTAIKDLLSTWQAVLTLITGAVGLLFIIANNIPDTARFVERFLAFLAGREVPAVEVVIPREGDEVPEKQ